MKKYHVVGIIVLACVFSFSEGRSEIALTQEQEQKAAKIDSLTRFYHEQGVFSGTVLVAEAGKVIYQEGFGYANVDSKEKLGPESVFRLASLSKQFTAMCIMILKERGKLDYDDDIQKYLPEVKYDGITIRHLLWHTSGVPRYMEFMSRHYSDEVWYVNDDVLRVLAEDKPEQRFEPGEKYEYSNTGYLLLGSIVERVSGVPFNKFLYQNVFNKLGMSNSTFPFGKEEFDGMANRVRGYNRKKDGGYVDNDYTDYDYDVHGDGGMFSNVIDLFKWNQALATETLVSKDTMQEAYKPYVLYDGSVGDYGFGWSVSEVGANRVVEHSGSWIGFRTYILRDITNNHCVIVLTNLGNRKGAKLYNAFYNILMDKPYLSIINIERKTANNAQKNSD